ncbi:hypothetical protein TNCV_3017581 [Trichonephila clavipes]|nr:hypothetical protein TNCV_3017581 [Trichonephila clavipes]
MMVKLSVDSASRNSQRKRMSKTVPFSKAKIGARYCTLEKYSSGIIRKLNPTLNQGLLLRWAPLWETPWVPLWTLRLMLRQHSMGDNTQPHRTHLVNEFHKKGNICRMDWLTRSPDLNHIGNIWVGPGKAIFQCSSNPRTPLELKVGLLEEWALLSQIMTPS